MIKFDIKPDLAKERVEIEEPIAIAIAVAKREKKIAKKQNFVLDEGEQDKKQELEQESEEESEKNPLKESSKEPSIMNELKAEYNLALLFARTTEIVPRGDDNWYKHCGVTMRKLVNTEIMTSADTLQFLVEHLVDMLLFNEKASLMNYIYSVEEFDENSLEYYIKKYLDSKIIRTKRLTSIILFSAEKIHVMILKGKRWFKAEAEDEREIAIETAKTLDFTKFEVNNIIGFIGLEVKNRYLVFKVKDMEAKRNTGARCDESSKPRKIAVLTELMGEQLFEKYTNGTTKGMVQPELCSLEELLFRYYNKSKKNNKVWFFDFESTMLSKKELKI
jgi:hypothetical protein